MQDDQLLAEPQRPLERRELAVDRVDVLELLRGELGPALAEPVHALAFITGDAITATELFDKSGVPASFASRALRRCCAQALLRIRPFATGMSAKVKRSELWALAALVTWA